MELPGLGLGQGKEGAYGAKFKEVFRLGVM